MSHAERIAILQKDRQVALEQITIWQVKVHQIDGALAILQELEQEETGDNDDSSTPPTI